MNSPTAQTEQPSRRDTPIHPAERIARRIRNAPWLARLDWLWNLVRPYYDLFARGFYPKGVEWNINGTDPIKLSSKFRTISENHEPESWKVVMGETRTGDVIADVGAAIGMYTLAFGKRVGPTGRVIAIEPDPSNFTALKEHVDLNDLSDRVELINCVAGSRPDPVYFCSGKGVYSHVTLSAKKGCRLIKGICLDEVFADQTINIMKIDVEGYEEEVLKGALGILRSSTRGPRLIYLELHPWAWAEIGVNTTIHSLLFLLKESNYDLFTVGGEPLTSLDQCSELIARRSQNTEKVQSIA